MNSSNQPPRLLLRFFRWFCHPDLVKYIEGDLIELFEERVREKGVRKARWLFTWDVVKLFRPGIIRPAGGTYRMNQYGMFKNYLKVAFRNLFKAKAYGVVNILGLVLAFTTLIVIIEHINFESSFDSFHEKKERIYRVEMESIQNGERLSKQATTFSAIGPEAAEEISGIESYARFFEAKGGLFTPVSKTGDSKSFRMPSVTWAEEAFLSIFTFGTIDPKALREPNSIVLTASVARKFFGDENPIGRTIFYQGSGDVRDPDLLLVTGVVEDVPENSHLKFEVLISYSTHFRRADFMRYSWGFSRAYTYLLLEPNIGAKLVEAQISDLVVRHQGEKMKAQDRQYKFELKPIEEIHLTSGLQYEMDGKGNVQTIYFLYVAAFLILAISWLNTVNLTNALNSMRVREIGIRKVLGAHKLQVFFQLFIESLLSNVIAMSLAILLVITLGNLVEKYLNISLAHNALLEPLVFGILISIVLAGSLISSVDPSLWKSAFRKSKTSNTVSGNPTIRGSGIVFQFAISLVMIIVTLTVRSQLTYINNFDLGIEKEHSIVLNATGRPGSQADLHQSTQLFKTTIKQHSWLKSISACNSIPGRGLNWMAGFREEGRDLSEGKEMTLLLSDEYFLTTLGLVLKAGRDFRYPRLDTTSLYGSVILNNTAVNQLGFESAELAIGKTLVDHRNQRRYHVVGVIEDYHQESLKSEIAPLVIGNHSTAGDYFILNLKKGQIDEQLDVVEQLWSSFYPGIPFDFFFLDDYIDRQYQSEREFDRLFTLFSTIGILIACMGMFSLSSFYATKRTKEVGIRKVLGAGLLELIWLLSSKFLLLTLIGIVIAVPIAHFATGVWLDDFVYRITTNWWLYAAAGMSLLLIACFTVCIQTFKAANVNPVEALRDE